MIKFPNLLLVAGTGRNSGKTTFACSIINKFSKKIKVTGLKISPHFHGGTDSLKLLVGNGGFNLYEESSAVSNKDSSKMLQAGAVKVFYIETTDTQISQAFETFVKHIEPGSPVICESPALRNFIDPGLFFILDNIDNIDKKESILKWRNESTGFFNLQNENSKKEIIDRIQFNKGKWYIT